MSGFDQELAVKLILDGVEPEIAVLAAQMSSDRSDVAWIIEPVGDLADMPDPSCVAAQLGSIKNPTREDIVRALAVCSR